eukprot:14216646-Alexandrium_andersonii.AAC.1
MPLGHDSAASNCDRTFGHFPALLSGRATASPDTRPNKRAQRAPGGACWGSAGVGDPPNARCRSKLLSGL